MQPLDVLAFAAHPDDVELSIGGTMCLLNKQGYRTGVVDFTRGELGSRGTPEGRLKEAAEAAEIMGLDARENLGIPDGDIANSKENQLKVIRAIRRYQPHIALLNAPADRHPDHPAAAELTKSAIFYAGLVKIETFEEDGTPQEPWRPNHILHYMQTQPFEPTLVVDVSEVWEERLNTMRAFKSQFHNPNYEADSDEPETFISNPEFFQFIEARARHFGYTVGATHGEPFLYVPGPFGVKDLAGTFGLTRNFR